MKAETEMNENMGTEGSLKKSRTQWGPFKLTPTDPFLSPSSKGTHRYRLIGIELGYI